MFSKNSLLILFWISTSEPYNDRVCSVKGHLFIMCFNGLYLLLLF